MPIAFAALKVEAKVKLGRLFNRQIPRLFSLQYPVARRPLFSVGESRNSMAMTNSASLSNATALPLRDNRK
jgi:hypothetical protein